MLNQIAFRQVYLLSYNVTTNVLATSENIELVPGNIQETGTVLLQGKIIHKNKMHSLLKMLEAEDLQ